jgi:hypothetical protein
VRAGTGNFSADEAALLVWRYEDQRKKWTTYLMMKGFFLTSFE